MTAITIERELLEQALVALSAPNHCVFSEPPICVDIRAALAAPATAPAQPAWHDAPTCEGLWALDDGTTCRVMPGASLRFDAGEGTRWYGPLPEDKQ